MVGAGAGLAAGAAKSNRSPRPEEAETGDDLAGADAKKPPDAGFDSCGEAADFFIPAVRFANGDDLEASTGAAGCVLKLKPLKELLKSPNEDVFCGIGGDPNPAIVGLCGLTNGFGWDAYSERIDLLRSGREDEVIVPGFAVTEEGLGDGDAGGPPKKSRPRSEVESAGLDFCTGAAGAMVGAMAGASSPKMSRLLAFGAGAGGDDAAAAADFLSSFSCTFFNGTLSSSSSSRVDGSGIPPSITHRLDSYLVRMKFSILASEGTWPGARLASQYLFARVFPHLTTLCSCSSVQLSRSTDLTLLMCVPIPRWIPEHLMQIKIPRFQLAHRGSLLRLQSAQTRFPGSFRRFLMTAWFAAALSAAGLSRRDMTIAGKGFEIEERRNR